MPDHSKAIAILKDHLISTPSSPELNVALLGSGGVGKRCMRMRLTVGHYCETYDPTLEEQPPREWGLFNTGQRVLTHWAEIETEYRPKEYPQVKPKEDPLSYGVDWMQKMDGCLLVFSCTSRRSFDHVKALYEAYCRDGEDEQRKIALIASKMDLIDVPGCPEARQVVEDAEKFCESHGLTLLKMSAKTGEGCSDGDAQNIVLDVLLQKFGLMEEPEEEELQPQKETVVARIRLIVRKMMKRSRR